MDNEDKGGILRRILAVIFKVIKVYFISLGFFVTITPFLIVLIIYNLVQPGEVKVDRSVIGINERVIISLTMDGRLAEHTPDETQVLLSRLFNEKPPLQIADVTTVLRRGAKDKRVKGLFVVLHRLNGSFAGFTELRSAIKSFKASGKPVYFYLDSADTKDYYLASIADEIMIPEASDINLLGPAFNLIYFKSALEKLGVGFEVVRAGRYKSAFEALVEDVPSEATIEMYDAIREHLAQHVASEVADSRAKSPEEVRGWLQRSLFSPKEAIHHGIVNGVGYLDDFRDRAKLEMNADNYLDFHRYLRASEGLEKPITSHRSEKLALIEAIGPIVTNSSSRGGRVDEIAPDRIIKELQWARDNNDIKAVVLRISSPGGVAYAADMIWDEVRKLTARKPVVISMGDVAASGGYYIAAPATKVLADPTSITGSIGVISLIPNLGQFQEKYGVSFHVVAESERVGLLNPASLLSDQDKELLGHQTEIVYDLFLQKVADGRHLELDKVRALAGGRVYTGMEALELGLVDRLGGLNEAFEEAKILSGLNPQHLYQIARYRGSRLSIIECLRSGSDMMNCFDELSSRLNVSVQYGLRRFVPQLLLTKELEALNPFIMERSPLAYWSQYPAWQANHLQ